MGIIIIVIVLIVAMSLLTYYLGGSGTSFNPSNMSRMKHEERKVMMDQAIRDIEKKSLQDAENQKNSDEETKG